MKSILRLAGTSALSILLTTALVGGCQKEKAVDEKDGDKTKSIATNAAGAGKAGKKPHNGPSLTKRTEIPAPPDVAGAPADAKKTESGLAYKVLSTEQSAGDRPGINDTVEVNYTGWTTDGKMFDTSTTRKAPTKFPVSKVIKGWTEGVQLMRVGEKFRFWIPEELAYKGRKGPQGMLVFDVELVGITKAPPVPEDVAAPPKNAKKTPKGVFYKVLKASKSKEKPEERDKVHVHYSGWTTDGKMFDSSVARGKRPATFGVKGVIPGWTDALLQMNTGAKWRVWIPKELAYNDQPGRPQGMLVFDMELLRVEKPPKPIPPPKDVKAPAKDAKKTTSGVFFKIFKPSQGAKPTATSKVKVHYTGWTTDGKMFDSSVQRGAPATFGLQRVVPGWRDGLQEMKVGEKARIWIPEELAYKGQKGAPAGMLVFDIELIEIVE